MTGYGDISITISTELGVEYELKYNKFQVPGNHFRCIHQQCFTSAQEQAICCHGYDDPQPVSFPKSLKLVNGAHPPNNSENAYPDGALQ